MIDIKQINEWVQEFINTLPPGVKNLPDDMQQHVRAAFQQTLIKLDLVTREEFDTQVKVLQKTRIKLEHLEQRLHEMESANSDHQ